MWPVGAYVKITLKKKNGWRYYIFGGRLYLQIAVFNCLTIHHEAKIPISRLQRRACGMGTHASFSSSKCFSSSPPCSSPSDPGWRDRRGWSSEIKRRAPDHRDVQESADNKTARGESDLWGMWGTLPGLSGTLAGIFKSSCKSLFMFILASFNAVKSPHVKRGTSRGRWG